MKRPAITEVDPPLGSACAGDDLASGSFSLHSRFSQVVNFVNDQKELVYLTSNPEFMASNGIFFPYIPLEKISALTILEEVISLNGCVYQRKDLLVIDTHLSFPESSRTAFENSLFSIPEVYLSLFPEKSLVFLLNPGIEVQFTSDFDRQFRLNACESAHLIREGKILDGLLRIKGTGYGLSPSGDDFIAGFLLGLHVLGGFGGHDFLFLRDKIFDQTVGDNLLTVSFLKNAKKGSYFLPLKKVLFLLVHDDKESLEIALKQLLAIGATSGADLLTGLIFSVKYMRDL